MTRRTGSVSDCAGVGDEGMGWWLLSRQRRRKLRFASSTGVLTCTDTITLGSAGRAAHNTILHGCAHWYVAHHRAGRIVKKEGGHGVSP